MLTLEELQRSKTEVGESADRELHNLVWTHRAQGEA